MGVDAHVARGAAERLPFAVGDVLLRLGVAVLLRHAKVDDVDDVRALCPRPADEEVVGLDVLMNEVARVNVLNARDLDR